jgi:hypothetical protein
MGAAFRKVDERRGEQRFHVFGLYGVAVLGAGIVERRGVHVDQRALVWPSRTCAQLWWMLRSGGGPLCAAPLPLGLVPLPLLMGCSLVWGSHYSRRGC